MNKYFKYTNIILSLLEKLWQRFPNGYLTEDEFSANFYESKLFGSKNKKFYPAKHLFAIIDRNKSGIFIHLYVTLTGF